MTTLDRPPRSIHRIWRSLIATLVLSAALIPSDELRASVGSSTELPISHYADMVVDELHQQVFVSGGPWEDVVVILDFEGNLIGTIEGMPGAHGMALDGTTLYVALSLERTIDLIDTETLEWIDSISVSPKMPDRLALAGGRIWFGYNCSSNEFEGIASLDPTTGVVTDYRGMAGYPYHCPTFATTGSNPDLLVAAELSGAELFVYDASTEPPTLLTSRRSVDRLQDIAITPDGATLLVASVTPRGVLAFSLPHLSDAGSYPTTMWKTSVAGSGQHLAFGGRPYDYWEDEVLIFPLGGGTARNWYKVEPPNVLPGGLRFRPDSSALFAVSEGVGVVFHVLEGPTRDGSRVSLTEGPSSVTAGNPVSLSGMLERRQGSREARRPVDGPPKDRGSRLVRGGARGRRTTP